MIPILEILEIEVCIFARILEILKTSVFPISAILEIWEIEVSIIPRVLELRAAGGRLQGLCCAALDYFWNMFPGISGYPGNIGNMFFSIFLDFSKKDAHRNFTQDAPTDEPRSLI